MEFEKLENGDVAMTLEILARVRRGGVRKTVPGTRHPLYPLLVRKTYNGEGRGQNRELAREKNKGKEKKLSKICPNLYETE